MQIQTEKNEGCHYIFYGDSEFGYTFKECCQKSSFFGEYCQVCFQEAVRMFLFHAKIYIACIINDFNESHLAYIYVRLVAIAYPNFPPP